MLVDVQTVETVLMRVQTGIVTPSGIEIEAISVIFKEFVILSVSGKCGSHLILK